MNSNKKTILFCHFLFLLGIFIIFIFANSPVFAETATEEQVVQSWSEGLEDLSEEEKNLLTLNAQEKLQKRPTKSGFFTPPGADSEIVSNPILFDYVQKMERENKPLESNAQALVDQTKDQFFFLETGLSIQTKKYEDIDVLIFELKYSPNKVSTFSKLPASKTKSLFTLGGETKINLGGDFQLAIGKKLIGENHAKAAAKGKQDFNFQWEGNYDIEKVEIATTGVNLPRSRWMIASDDLINDEIRFFIVLRVPQSVKEFKISTLARFIDERIWPLENSKTDKHLTYICKTQPPGCETEESP